MSVRHALKWSFFGEIAAKVIQPVIFVILARLLTPDDFGVMSAALMIISFSQVFWEAGLGKALIQRQSDIEQAANSAFWINLALGSAMAVLLLVSAAPIADTFFDDERVSAVIQVMTLYVLLGALCSIQTALLQKHMAFKQLFWVRLATTGLPALASIPLALSGWGFWSLVVGTLIGQLAQAVVLWRSSEWRPRLAFDKAVAADISCFGSWVALSGLLTWFYLWADALVVGMYLGSHELGLYRTGNQFAAMLFALLFGPITPVLYSHLSTFKGDSERLRQTTARLIQVLGMLGIPLSIILLSLAEPLSSALFGVNWSGIAPVIGIMALVHGASWVVGMNGEVYRAAGKPQYEAIVSAATLLVYLGAYLISIRYGLEVFLWTRLLLALGALVLHLVVLRKVVTTPVLPILGFTLLTGVATAIVIFPTALLSKNLVHSAWGQLLLGGASTSLLAGIVVLLLLDRNGVLKDLLRSMLDKPLRRLFEILRNWQTHRTFSARNSHTATAQTFHFDSFAHSVSAFVDSLRVAGQTGHYRYALTCGAPTLYGSAYACATYSMLGRLDQFPEDAKQAWVSYFDSFQSEHDGLFYDPAVANDVFADADWWGARHLALHMISAYTDLGAKPRHPFRFLAPYYDAAYREQWLKSVDWTGLPIGKRDDFDNQVMNIGCLLQYQRDRFNDERAGAAVEHIKTFLKSKLNPESGLWGAFDLDNPDQRSRAVQYAYHLLQLFFYDGDPPVNANALVEHTLNTQNRLGGYGVKLNASACEDIDSIDILMRLSPYVSHEHQQRIRASLQQAFRWVMMNQVNDGGFVFRLHESFVYGHEHTSSRTNTGAMLPTWFRTLSLVYLCKALGTNNPFKITRCPGYVF